MKAASTSDMSLSDLPFMAAFPTPAAEQWRAAVDKVLKGGDFEKRLVSRSADGIRIEPLYPAATPAARPTRAGTGRWGVCARVDHPDPVQAQTLALADLEGGATGLALSFAGARAARGYGLVAANVADLDAALEGVMLDLIALRIDPAPQGHAQALMLAALVEARGLSPAATAIDFGLDPIGVLATQGRSDASWADTGSHVAGTIRSLRDRGFAGPFLCADARPYHEAGATEAQELGAALANATAYLRMLETQGLPLGEARDAISFMLVADTDEFMTVAKFRAARLLWARIQQACGLDPKPMVLHAETAWRSLTKRDPHVNMLRATVATFAAGIGGADSLTVLPFTAALGLPDGFARRVARNTQLVLLEEANLWRVADPAAGAGGFEALTQALCDQGWRKFQDLEREAADGLPGIVSALRNGHVQAGLARQREADARAVATRRQPITGTSEFANLAEAKASVLTVAPVRDDRSTAETSRAPEDVLDVQPLPAHRIAEDFEALRDTADAALAASGSRPHVFLAVLGSVAEFTARAAFARNLFEAGGLAAPVPESFAAGGATDIAALVAACRASGARLACLCGSDAGYEAEAIAAGEALAASGARVWLAGRPGDLEAGLREAGVDTFIQAGCNAVAVLAEAQAFVLAALPK